MRNREYRPTLPQLRAFVAIADTGHFGQAARRLGISQPSLSQALATLEQGLEVQLVERSTRRVLVTPLGRGLLPLARQVSELVDEVVDRAAGRSEGLSGPLSIGFIPTIAPYVLPNFLRLVREELPDLEPRIHEEPTTYLVEALRSGTIDIAIMALPSGTAVFEDHRLYDEEFQLVLPEGHPLAGREDVPLTALEDLDLLLLDDGHCMRDQVLDLCRSVDAHRTDDSGMETRAASLSTVVQCVAGGLGETLIPASAIDVEATRPGLTTARFAGPVRPGRTVGMVHRTSSVRGPEFERIGELVLRAYLATGAEDIGAAEHAAAGAAG
ncbi:hydrogen peroxide-inducible genes activator [Corynebacterium sphenisci]|uniref:hydrogen peroxide-inducible genes activator n=1 Tax=Corynebacterium sphenisci TaxID=191493 RepID=UPI00095238AE|nr:hydrogen peroxide-inducible genes activator [Corynebacterium sphenisci]